MRVRSTPAPGLRLVFLTILIVMALTADTRFASAAPGGAEQGAAPPLTPDATPLDRQGIWVWCVDRSEGGSTGRIVARSQQAGKASEGPPVDGAIGATTWQSLLNFDPVRPRWAGRRAKRGGGATASRAFPPRRPLSASLAAKANEIDPGPAP